MKANDIYKKKKKKKNGEGCCKIMNIDFCNKEMQIGYADICKDCFMNQKYELTGTISFY